MKKKKSSLACRRGTQKAQGWDRRHTLLACSSSSSTALRQLLSSTPVALTDSLSFDRSLSRCFFRANPGRGTQARHGPCWAPVGSKTKGRRELRPAGELNGCVEFVLADAVVVMIARVSGAWIEREFSVVRGWLAGRPLDSSCASMLPSFSSSLPLSPDPDKGWVQTSSYFVIIKLMMKLQSDRLLLNVMQCRANS